LLRLRDQIVKKYFHLYLERFARALVDFIAVQLAGVAALVFIGMRGATPPSEAVLAHYYFHTFLPISLVFPLVHSLFGLYTRLRGYTLGYKLRLAALSASVASMLVVFVSLLLNSAILPRMSAAIFSVGAVVAAVGIRWLKDFLFHRESEDESSKIVPAVSFASTTQDAAGSVLVVGGAGYIGSIVTAKLLERGCKVRLLDNLFYGNQAIEPLLSNPNLEFILGDSRNIQDVVRAMSGVSHVIHLAAIVGDPACAEDKANAFQINYAATRMLLEIAKGQGIERFLFASSCSVYGASDSVTDERSETQPISLYAETKLQSEGVLLEARSRSFHPTVLRFATVFGLAPRPRFDLVVNLLTAKAIQDGVITVYNGDQWRPFIHVRDVAAAIVDVFAAPLASVTGEIFNVGDDTLNYTLAQVAEKIREHIPQTRVEYVENADRRNYRVSFKKIRDCIGYTAKLSVDDGILEIKRAFERGVIQNYRQPFYSNVSYLKERGHVEAKTELDVKVMAAFAGAGSRPVATLPQIPRYSPPQPSHMTDDSASLGSSSSSIS
jgi:nucleoside-diphosphate-sugar epimerase